MNNKGFTLVEIISVVALLAIVIIITVPIIGNVSENIKKSTLKTKVENIKKAAILYGQDNREYFDSDCDLCSSVKTGECKCFNETITVSKLLNPGVDNNTKDGYIESDDELGNIINSINDNIMNDCEIQLYQKYGKIYAVYTNIKEGDTEYNFNCWYQD